jgi:hypothetical protein
VALNACSVNGKAGFKHGPGGTCFTHDGTAGGKQSARASAIKQGLKGGKKASLFSERPWWIPRSAETRPDA